MKIVLTNENENIKEIEIIKEKFTAGAILDSEKEFLMTGGIYPQTGMEDSKDYCLMVASKMNKVSYDKLKEILTGEELIKISKEIRGFFGRTVLEELIHEFSEKH